MSEDHLLEDFDQFLGKLARFRNLVDPAGKRGDVPATLSESYALRRLQHDALTQRDLGDYLGLEKSTISRLVDGMLAKGWVTQTRDPSNGRQRIITLTEAGRGAATIVEKVMLARHQRMIAGLSAEERAGLSISLPGLVRSLPGNSGTMQAQG